MRTSKSYSQLRRLETFEERYDYLALKGVVGEQTFGFDRWVNQEFYRSSQWQHVRNEVIVRDNGCDLGITGYEIQKGLLVHHMNPMTVRDLERGMEWVLDPEYLVTTTQRTHNAIHYGVDHLQPRVLVKRTRGDTKLW